MCSGAVRSWRSLPRADSHEWPERTSAAPCRFVLRPKRSHAARPQQEERRVLKAADQDPARTRHQLPLHGPQSTQPYKRPRSRGLHPPAPRLRLAESLWNLRRERETTRMQFPDPGADPDVGPHEDLVRAAVRKMLPGVQSTTRARILRSATPPKKYCCLLITT